MHAPKPYQSLMYCIVCNVFSGHISVRDNIIHSH